MKLNLYEFIMEEKGNDNVYKMRRPAEDEEVLKYRYGGNGEFVTIRDVTDNYPISVSKVIKALKKAEFGEEEIDVISYSLQQKYNNVID